MDAITRFFNGGIFPTIGMQSEAMMIDENGIVSVFGLSPEKEWERQGEYNKISSTANELVADSTIIFKNAPKRKLDPDEEALFILETELEELYSEYYKALSRVDEESGESEELNKKISLMEGEINKLEKKYKTLYQQCHQLEEILLGAL